MDAAPPSSHSHRDRSRLSLSYIPPAHIPAQLNRTSSRSSTSTSNSRLAPHSNNSSSSNLHSPSKTHQHPRLKHSSRTSLGSDGLRSSRLTRESTHDELRSPTDSQGTPISSYLHEKLQLERRSENERSLASRSGSQDAMSSTSDVRTGYSSPARASTSDGPRPRSNSGIDPTRKKGLALRDSEQELAKLQQQNFDLKFEMFHRRKRNAELEVEVEDLQKTVDELKKQKDETAEVNDKLLEELEKRDKAINDAVAMIVKLEATVEKLQKERDIVRSLSAEPYIHRRGPSAELKTPTQDVQMHLPSSEAGSPNTLARMPSFLSDRSEHTENLRNVYLAPRISTLSFKRALDAARDDDANTHNLMSTPSLSVLSESSFLSVYGQKPFLNSSSSPPARSDSVDVQETPDRRTGFKKPPTTHPRAVTPTRQRRSSSSSRRFPSGNFPSMAEAMDSSPLQRLENSLCDQTMLSDLSAANGGTPATSRLDHSSPQLPQMTLEQQQIVRQRTKQEKRDALRKVMTDTPRELGYPFPPTPDTISTSTLRRFKNSNDTLSQHRLSAPHQHVVSGNDRAYLASMDLARSRSSSRELPVDGHGRPSHPQPPSTSAFSSRKGDPNAGISPYLDSRLDIPPRPRSAGETTTSYERRDANGWASDISDESDDDNDGATVSTYDYWMREGMKPNRKFPHSGAGSGGNPVSASAGGRTSPDLFSFPTMDNGSGGWASSAMFGSLGGAGIHGAPTSQTLDALGASLPAPQTGRFGSGLASPGPLNTASVPTPPRRSSLHARTGSRPSSRASPGGGKLRKSPVRNKSRSRRNSVDVVVLQQPLVTTPTLASPPHQGVTPEPSKRQYPPISGQQAPSRRSSGINNFFRRSFGGGSSDSRDAENAQSSDLALRNAYPQHPQEATNAATAAANGGIVGIPSWGRRADLSDEGLTSATPPPIMRNPRGGRRGSVAVEDAADEYNSSGAPLSPAVMTSPAPEQSPGRKRGWLGRVGTLRNRATAG